MRVSLEKQVSCVKREIAIRERVYPGFVKKGRMKPGIADEELLTMQAVLKTLEGLPRLGLLRQLIDLASQLDEQNHCDRGAGPYEINPIINEAKAAITGMPDGIPRKAGPQCAFV